MMQVTETQSENPISLGQQRTAQQTAIIAFTARYYSNLPFQDPQPTLLKEFLPGARSLGCNELQLLNHLHALPQQKWRAAYAPLSPDPPIVPLLGASPTAADILMWSCCAVLKSGSEQGHAACPGWCSCLAHL